jgi:hypothetical protein
VTYQGIGVQAMTAVRARQQVRVRFQLRYPPLRVDARGEVIWATFTGQCGIRMLDLSPEMVRQINEWIFGDMLEDFSLHLEGTRSIFAKSTLAESWVTPSSAPDRGLEGDGLMVSPTPRKVIELPVRELPVRPEPAKPVAAPAPPINETGPETAVQAPVELDWLSQPLSGRGLIWTINTLVMVAALLLFALVVLLILREPPRWPLAMAAGAVVFVGALYWGFFKAFGGTSPGARLARLMGAGSENEEEAGDERFR